MLFPSKLIKQEYPFIFFLSFLCVVEYLIFQTLSYADANVFIDVDEIEHLRASYNILAGRIPFRDFFEHHHLLLNYLFTPVVFLFPKDPVIILIARFFIYGILFLIVSSSFKVNTCFCEPNFS